jgi:hypothetical protein
MPTKRNSKAVVARLRKMFLQHDKHEKRLVMKIRREGEVPPSAFDEHNELERRIIYAMADATDVEIAAAELG